MLLTVCGHKLTSKSYHLTSLPETVVKLYETDLPIDPVHTDKVTGVKSNDILKGPFTQKIQKLSFMISCFAFSLKYNPLHILQ